MFTKVIRIIREGQVYVSNMVLNFAIGDKQISSDTFIVVKNDFSGLVETMPIDFIPSATNSMEYILKYPYGYAIGILEEQLIKDECNCIFCLSSTEYTDLCVELNKIYGDQYFTEEMKLRAALKVGLETPKIEEANVRARVKFLKEAIKILNLEDYKKFKNESYKCIKYLSLAGITILLSDLFDIRMFDTNTKKLEEESTNAAVVKDLVLGSFNEGSSLQFKLKDPSLKGFKVAAINYILETYGTEEEKSLMNQMETDLEEFLKKL